MWSHLILDSKRSGEGGKKGSQKMFSHPWPDLLGFMGCDSTWSPQLKRLNSKAATGLVWEPSWKQQMRWLCTPQDVGHRVTYCASLQVGSVPHGPVVFTGYYEGRKFILNAQPTVMVIYISELGALKLLHNIYIYPLGASTSAEAATFISLKTAMSTDTKRLQWKINKQKQIPPNDPCHMAHP